METLVVTAEEWTPENGILTERDWREDSWIRFEVAAAAESTEFRREHRLGFTSFR
jgi:hypothetical protein